MNSKSSQRCVSALACLGIVLLFAILVVVWVQFYQGSFRTGPLQRKNEESQNRPLNYTVSAQVQQQANLKPRLKDYRENSYFDSLGLEKNVEYVKPMKISPLPLHDHDIIFNEMNNYSNQPVFLHHSGHFRHTMADVWDPHPNYEIDAFGQKLRLQLAHDNNFIGPNLYISHAWENHTHRIPYDQRKLGCFYTGRVEGDSESDVVVSLCNGMTGYIRTAEANYYIEPIENRNGTMNSFLHRIKKVPHSSNRDNEVTPVEETTRHKCGTNVSKVDLDNKIQEDYPIALDLHNSIHNLVKRSTASFPSTNSTGHASWKNLRRKKRDDEEYFQMNDGQEDFEENIPQEYFIKVLVVADRSMLEFYKTKDELNYYILTLMSQTSRLFKDPSIGNAISVSVTEIRILEKQDFQAENSQATLNKFCEWKENYTARTNHDVALLLSRHDFCEDRDQECATVGIAQVGAMCGASSCAVAIDKGLPTTYTIAHEIGHVLNIPHDTDDKRRCANLNKGESQKYIMTHLLEKDIKPWMWSPCSKYYVTEFLRSNKAKCLLKRPTTNFISTELANIPPGEKYEVKRQCEFEFGEGRDYCMTENEPPCLHLWCTEDLNEGCSTHHMPWAEGTYCGTERWCHNGQCIPFKENDLKPVAGGWGPWSEWGECTRTCGGGVKVSQRLCDTPLPENGGDYCFGHSIRYASCNTEPCPDDLDFRAVQCAEFNGNNINLNNLPKDVKWLPKYGLGKEDQCKLYCRLQHSNAYYLLRSKVVDGTKCGFNSFGICVDGKCRTGGCDNRLHSKMKLDDCGVCGGDNSQCEEISGSYNVTATSTGYSPILKIPKGSSSLDIRQKDMKGEKLKNYLALVDGETGNYILNGNNIITEHQKDVPFGGSIIKYSGSNALTERITTAKNEILTKPLVLHILTIDSRSPRPDITYRYIISRENAPSYSHYDTRKRILKNPISRIPRYSWRLYQKEWTECSSICSGFQFMKPVCIELGNNEQTVDDFYCASRDTNGILQKKECNNHCRLIWSPIHRGECSVNCGTGVRSVKYNCLKIDNEREKYGFLQIITADTYGDVVDDKYCSNLPKPQFTEKCTGSCNVKWQYSDWSQCSQTCGGGIQTRKSNCIDNDSGLQVADGDCKDLNKITERECKNNKCPEWVSSEWSKCSTECGRGFKDRAVFCRVGNDDYKEHFCDHRTKPEGRVECIEKPCVQWATDLWSPCSSTCGNGVQTREVYCETKDEHRVIDLSQCPILLKPNETKLCNVKKCPMLLSAYPVNRYHYPVEQDVTVNSISIDFKMVEGRWITGPWSRCSKSCGGGYSIRKVICRGDRQGHSCDIRKKPVTTTNCNMFQCPQWQLGGWTACDENCEKHRLVACQNHMGNIVADSRCQTREKPSESTKCKLSQCPHLTNTVPKQYFDSREDDKSGRYKWVVGKWKECSSHCGKGIRNRKVTCEDTLNDVTLVDQFCKGLAKPKITKPCERFNCAFTWIDTDWSSCSAKCGSGFKTRNVTCHKVYPGGLIDPNPMPDLRSNRYARNYCDMYRKPEESVRCRESNCGDSFVWRAGPWQQCTQKCGRRGRQARKLFCVKSSTGEKVGKRLCPRNLRPKRKRKCNQWRCAHKSCMDAKYNLKTKENKDYLLELNGRKAIVYCFKMDTREPEEYISLLSDIHNFAEKYNKRLLNLSSCPHQGDRHDDCECDDIGPERSGITRFYKVRLNITTMRIIDDDFTFSSQIRGQQIPYGTAGDCYSTAESCGQGRFSIDLTGTSFKLTNDVSWIGNITRIHQAEKTAGGKCGGYCGYCMPNPNTGLQVEVT